MKLNQIFSKPVDRPIEGVIKADDESGLLTEVDEYVLTNEVSKRLENFLEAYNNPSNANGSWISGFFGSGKSHLLKMLALILENRSIEGKTVLERFLPKCQDNALLQANLRKAASIPSKSILFNIDLKADVISKTQADALLAVFVKVFNEMCGYYGKQGHIANFERDLDQRGLLSSFKTCYQEISGRHWESGREQALLESENISAAYARVSGSPTVAEDILDKYERQYKLSIEDFAQMVNDYINRQGPNFRLNFLVDEVGQYIADHIKLMTNLQTVAEGLATKCKGRAWIIVTAQEDMTKIVGDMNAKQENDFSKIQARFGIRMPMTSQNVAEVIQKRLLYKTQSGSEQLKRLYADQVNNFGTLFSFSDGSQTYRNFHDEAHFVISYPFIPYQFDLFQNCIKALSEHNAFEGKNSSVGERSMLAVFQQVAIHIADHEVGQLATFDLMFEGIRNALKSQIQTTILNAENNLDAPFAIRILKVLFLVKYVKGFKATVHNLSVLMTDRFGGDIIKLRRDVEEALNLLEMQTYIQRNGELFEFLTNEEKDIESEIKHTDVDSDAVSAELVKIIFDKIIRDRKIRFEDNSQDFSYSRKLDEQLNGREYEIAINVISPFHEHFDSEQILISHSMGRDELLVILPPDSRLMQELMMFKRTEKYIQQNYSVTQQESVKRILTDRGAQNNERARQLEARVKDLIVRAKLFIGGTPVEAASTDAFSRVVKAFQELVRRTYPQLKMLHNKVYSEAEIDSYLRQAPSLLSVDQSMSEAEQEMLATINSNRLAGIRTTLKALDEKFERKPYGWSLAAVQCNLALLAGHGKIELRKDGTLQENAALVATLKNTQAFPNVVIEPQVEFTPAQVRGLKEFYGEFFDAPAPVNEARDLGRETGVKFKEMVETLKALSGNASLYPLLGELNGPISRLQELVGKPYGYYLTDLPGQKDALLDMKEDIIAPILAFWRGPQKTLFDEARSFYQAQSPNFAYLGSPESNRLADLLASREIYKGNQMQQLRTTMDALKASLMHTLETRRAEARAKIEGYGTRLASMPEYASLTQMQKDILNSEISGTARQIQDQTLIARINDIERRFVDVEYQNLLSRLTALARQAAEPAPQPGDTPRPVEVREPAPQYVALRGIHAAFDKAYLANEADVDAYLQALREKILAEIHSGKRVNL